jgi:hypothetical protein
MGARPLTLNASVIDLIVWLRAGRLGPDSPLAVSPLAYVRALTIRLGFNPPETAVVARLMSEAPHGFEHALWVLSETFTPEPAFAKVVHSRLRHVGITSKYYPQDLPVPVPVPVPDGCGMRLRQRHFPRLRRLTVDDEEHPV